ncbi:hypothetical protein DENSPDRAFT_853693 [Dentipellis sp. KUC8613]|nr:hypothetical protein DENSPDRAFT_853693 [Dentipellis sp. KUC8613]
MPTSSSPSTGAHNIHQWTSILTSIVFFLVNIIVIFPFKVYFPQLLVHYANKLLVLCRVIQPRLEPLRRKSVKFNFLTVPLIAVLFLLAVRAIDGTDVRRGILGADGVKPINIMALFISLAYMSISLDASGLFRFLAYWVARKGGSSGPRLYLYLYVFFLLSGVLIGNDPIILSGTAFLAYLTRMSGITPPTAWIFAQFIAANMASAVLVSSNITNLVLAGAFSLSFITYSSSLILPFLAAALLIYPFLVLVLFRSSDLIPRAIDLPSDDSADANIGVSINNPSAALVDRHGAVFGCVLLVLTLGVLVGTSTIGLPVWEVTVPPAVIIFCRDLWHDWKRYRASRTARGAESGNGRPRPLGGIDSVNVEEMRVAEQAEDQAARSPQEEPVRHTESKPRKLEGTVIELEAVAPQRSASVLPGPSASIVSGKPPRTASSVLSLDPLVEMFPTVHSIATRLPIALLPFSFLMFILVQGLASKGWIEIFAGWWEAWVSKTGVVGAVAGMAVGSGLLCNICGTNIGTTILLARTLQYWVSSSQPRALIRYASIYALALGSNYGAFTLTFSASLAGLLWRDILRQKGIQVRRVQFAVLNMGPFVLATAASSAVLIGQAYIVHGKE